VPCPGGSGDFAGGCHVWVLTLLPAAGGVGEGVAAVSGRAAGDDAGLTVDIVIKTVLGQKAY
jgi:hypothetical protein